MQNNFVAPTLGSMYPRGGGGRAGAPAGGQPSFAAPSLAPIMAGLSGASTPRIPPRPTPPMPAPQRPQPTPRPTQPTDFARYLELAHPGFNSGNMGIPGYMEQFFQGYGR